MHWRKLLKGIKAANKLRGYRPKGRKRFGMLYRSKPMNKRCSIDKDTGEVTAIMRRIRFKWRTYWKWYRTEKARDQAFEALTGNNSFMANFYQFKKFDR